MKLKILIAEDDSTSDKLISLVIKNICSEIIHTKTGFEVIEAFRKRPDIQLILMDIRMPDMNGHDATRKIREFNKDVVIIAQTAIAMAGDREKALEAGCNYYISKPIDKNKLLNLIEKHFNPKI